MGKRLDIRTIPPMPEGNELCCTLLDGVPFIDEGRLTHSDINGLSPQSTEYWVRMNKVSGEWEEPINVEPHNARNNSSRMLNANGDSYKTMGYNCVRLMPYPAIGNDEGYWSLNTKRETQATFGESACVKMRQEHWDHLSIKARRHYAKLASKLRSQERSEQRKQVLKELTKSLGKVYDFAVNSVPYAIHKAPHDMEMVLGFSDTFPIALLAGEIKDRPEEGMIVVGSVGSEFEFIKFRDDTIVVAMSPWQSQGKPAATVSSVLASLSGSYGYRVITVPSKGWPFGKIVNRIMTGEAGEWNRRPRYQHFINGFDKVEAHDECIDFTYYYMKEAIVNYIHDQLTYLQWKLERASKLKVQYEIGVQETIELWKFLAMRFPTVQHHKKYHMLMTRVMAGTEKKKIIRVNKAAETGLKILNASKGK